MKLSGYSLFVICILLPQFLTAQIAPSLGAAQGFAVLGSSTITSTGPTVINGNVGVSPGSAVTGFPPAKINSGSIYSGAASDAGAAQSSANAAFVKLGSQSSSLSNNLTGKVLGETDGATRLKPGVYTFSSSAQLNSTLILDDEGDPNAVFIFKMGSTLTTASYSKVIMSSGGKGSNVFWHVGSSATIGTYTTFVGNIIANISITMTTGATTTGRLFALNGAVTMDTNTASAVANESSDADKDGVPDNFDEYPGDAFKAFNNYSSAGAGSTFIFEDQWPTKGDFDLNDLTMVSKYQVVTDAKGVVVQVIGTFNLLATGGDFENGYAIEFPFLPLSVKNLVGGVLEAKQAKAVVVLFSNMQNEMASNNTIPGVIKSPAKTYIVKFDVVNGPLLSDIGMEYNPFIFNKINGLRHEIHLPGQLPTSLADTSLFGTGDDNSNVNTGVYYVTKSGLPYGITLPTATFNYPIEGTDITKAYLHFAEWANSGGLLFQDWYSNTAPGYRNAALLYTK